MSSKRRFRIKRETQVLTWCLAFMAFPAMADGVSAEHQGGVQAVMQQQSIIVTGRVTGTNGVPLEGANIGVNGSQSRTTTDTDGRFAITVPSGRDVLVVSYTGYQSEEVAIGNQRSLTIQLIEDNQQISEVIVTGFGNLNQFNYDGSASVIKTDALKDLPNRTVGSMIQGNAPGISVTNSSSQPGGVTTLRIRGYGSYSASNSPLYVIDGIPVMSGDINSTGRSGNSGGTDIMATLNPSDISNITVIKDAAAASLWRSRAANGVILITTHQGNKNRTRVSFSTDLGQSDFAYTYRPVMSGDERRQFIYDAYVRRGMYVDGLSESDAIAYADGMLQADADRSLPRWSVEPWSGWTDWMSENFRKGTHNNQELSVSGGSDRTTYYASFSHNKSNGLQHTQSLDRYTGRLNVTYEAKDWLRLGTNLTFSGMNQSLGYDDNWYTSPTYAAVVKNTPSDPIYNEDGTFNTIMVGATSRNTIPYYEYNKNQQQLTRAFNTIFLEATPLPDVTLKTTLSYDFTLSRGDAWDHPINATQATLNGTKDRIYNEYRRMVWLTSGNYRKNFGHHHVDGLLAYEITDSYDNFLWGSVNGFQNFDYNEVSNGSVPGTVQGHFSKDRMVSYISRANYHWNHRYFLSGSFRRDGTSRLHANSRWGNFWSASAGWMFSEEPFMVGARNFLSNGKLRVSYGVNGNRPSGWYSYLSTVASNSYNGETALMAGNIANEKLVWESNYSLNTGLDLSIKNRVDLTIEYYSRLTKDLFMSLPVSRTTGYSSYTNNIGSMRNSGVELTVNAQNIRNSDLSWNTMFNISHNKNEIIEMDGTDADIIGASTIRRKGLPIYQYYVIEFSHINPDNGRSLFFMNDELPDGTLNRELTEDARLAARVPYKSPFPVATMGLSNNFRWKAFDLSFMLSSTLGGYSYDRAADKTETSGASDALINQLHTFYHDSWKKPGDIARFEAWIPGSSSTNGMGPYHNSRRIHSTDHLRLKNFTLGVSLPAAWASAIHVDQLRVYFAGQNLWTIAAHDQYDPEVPADGVMWYNTPPLKSYSLGININF